MQARHTDKALSAERPEIQSGAKFLFEEFRAAIGVANVFARVAASFKLQANCSAPKNCANSIDSLAVRVIEPPVAP